MHGQAVSNSSAGANSIVEDFFGKLRTASARVLLLDYGAALRAREPGRQSRTANSEIVTLVRQIRTSTNTSLAIVSRCQARDIAQTIGVAGIEYWGSHGVERIQADGSYEVMDLGKSARLALARASELSDREGLGEFARATPAGIAVHWSEQTARAEDLTRRMLSVWSKIAERGEVRLAPFDDGIELRTATRGKGTWCEPFSPWRARGPRRHILEPRSRMRTPSGRCSDAV